MIDNVTFRKGATENQGTGLPPSCAQRLKENIPFQVSFPKCICICVLDVNNFSHNYNCICVLDVTHLGHKDTSICVLYDTHLSVKYCKDDLQLVHVALTMQCVHLN